MALADDHTPPTRRRTATHLCCDVDRCPDNPGRAMAIFVRCIDNTLAADVLVVGEIYEVMHINERDGYYALSGLGRFSMARFQLVPLRTATVDAIKGTDGETPASY